MLSNDEIRQKLTGTERKINFKNKQLLTPIIRKTRTMRIPMKKNSKIKPNKSKVKKSVRFGGCFGNVECSKCSGGCFGDVECLKCSAKMKFNPLRFGGNILQNNLYFNNDELKLSKDMYDMYNRRNNILL